MGIAAKFIALTWDEDFINQFVADVLSNINNVSAPLSRELKNPVLRFCIGIMVPSNLFAEVLISWRVCSFELKR